MQQKKLLVLAAGILQITVIKKAKAIQLIIGSLSQE